MKDNSQTQNPLMILKVIWGAMFGAVLLYIIVTHVQAGPIRAELQFDFTDPMVLAMSFMALMAAVMSSLLPKFLMQKMKDSKSVRIVDRQSFVLEEAVQKFFVPYLIRLALIESVSLFGLVVSIMKEKNLILPFAGLAVFLMFQCFPSEKHVRSAFKVN